jgi:hypothetical protein
MSQCCVLDGQSRQHRADFLQRPLLLYLHLRHHRLAQGRHVQARALDAQLVSFGRAPGHGPDDVVYCTLPLYHATGLCVCWGSAIVVRRGSPSAASSAPASSGTMRRFNATTLGYVGELCRYLVDQPPSASDRDNRVTKMIGNGLRPGVGAVQGALWRGACLRVVRCQRRQYRLYQRLNFDNTIGFCLQHWALVDYDHDNGEPVRGPMASCARCNGRTGPVAGQDRC